MKVLFSNPPWWDSQARLRGPDGKETLVWRGGVRAGSRWPHTNLLHSSPDNFVFGDYLPYPFFLGYATTWVRQKTGADARFRDSIALRESYEKYFEHIQDERYDYIFIESASPSWEHDAKIIRLIAKACPETRVVVTGPITSSSDLKLLTDYPIHATIRGEYEKGAVKVINGASGALGFDLLTVEEMNSAPFPYFDRTYAHRYWDENPKGQSAPQLQIWASRGCPYKCIFCVWPATMTGQDPDGTAKRSVRHYSGAYIEAMVQHFHSRYGYATVYFDDDTFNLGNRHTLDMCDAMERVGLPWSAMCRADTTPLPTWKRMREAGCFGVKVGFESGNQDVVDRIVNKNLDLKKGAEAVRYMKSVGLTVHGTFTYGLPGETKEQMAETLAFRKSLPLDTFQESGTAEIEGTPLAELRKKGKLDKYADAVMDDSYTRDGDGAKKIQQMAREGLQ